jgi:hypothetical protein
MTSAPSRIAQNGMIALKRKEIDDLKGRLQGYHRAPGGP